MLSFKPTLSLFHLHQEALLLLFHFLPLGWHWYLRLLILLPAILIPAWASSSLAFHMMYSACKLNKQDDNRQLWCTPSPILNYFIVSCLVLTFISWPAHRFLWRQVRWSGIPISLRIFHSLLWSMQSKTLVNETEVDVFLEFICFFCDPADVGNLISDSSAFSKSSFNICKFSVQVLLKPSLENFEHYFASMWNEINCIRNILMRWLCI